MKKLLLGLTMAGTLVMFAAPGCTTTPSTKNDYVAAAQVSNTGALQLIEVAATNKVITKTDAQNLLKQVDTAEEGIKVANGLTGTDATDKLALSNNILKQIIVYLNNKGVK